MTILYVTSGPWGAGTGTLLSPAQIDGNFWDVASRLTTLENATPVHISGFHTSGANFYVDMSDSTTFGPYTLPTIQWRFRGPWAPLTVYAANDIVTSNGSVYLLLQSVTSNSGSFDPTFLNGGLPVYGLLLTNPASVLPSGGTTGQSLVKASNSDFDVHWASSSLPAGGSAGQVLAKIDGTDYNTHWVNGVQNLGDLLDVGVGNDSGNSDGDVLTWNAADQLWENQPGFRGASTFTVGTSSYVPQLGDQFSFVLLTLAGTVTVTIPNNSSTPFNINTEITLCADGAGTIVNVAAATGVTLEWPTGFLAQSLGHNAVMTIKKVDTNRWKLFGLLATAT